MNIYTSIRGRILVKLFSFLHKLMFKTKKFRETGKEGRTRDNQMGTTTDFDQINLKVLCRR